MAKDDDDFQLRSYQDDLVTDDNATDPLMDEVSEDPADELGIPRDEFKQELDKAEIDELDDEEYGDDIDIRDDEREYFQDLDENGKGNDY
ncbi:MAG TPA: hypothetical protein VMT96_00470 [Candidatus Bathyarchaeia archaeon]|nr:hypothetical protein [Candidatus Bathyarchaeia archaeon]